MKKILMVSLGLLFFTMAFVGFSYAGLVELDAPEQTVLEGKLNINTADIDELTMLPGIGVVTAGRIIEYRKEKGNFKSIDEIINVKGIGEKKLKMIQGHLAIEGESTLTMQCRTLRQVTTTK